MSASVGVYKYDPEELRTHVVQGGAEQFAQGLIAALKPKIHCALCEQTSGYNRWAYNLFAKVAKLAQADTMVLVAIMGQLGVSSENELKALVESGRRLQALSQDINPEALLEDGLDAVRLALSQLPPERRLETLKALGSHAIEGTNGTGA